MRDLWGRIVAKRGVVAGAVLLVAVGFVAWWLDVPAQAALEWLIRAIGN